jgi:hypothetical protein
MMAVERTCWCPKEYYAAIMFRLVIFRRKRT